MAPTAVRYVLFDMDGLMIDSERVYTDVTNAILAPYGAEMTWPIKAGLMGMPERAAAEHLLAHFPAVAAQLSVDAYLQQRTALQDAQWPHVRLLPAVARLVRHLHAHGIPTAIATGSQRRNFELKTAHLQHVFGLFGDRVVCGDDAWIREHGGRGKPAPDVFLVAARVLGRPVGDKPPAPAPEREGDADASEDERDERARGLVFEDALPGVQAAKRAGMKVVWVPDPNLLVLGDAHTAAGADAYAPDQVLSSLADFKPEEWGLPPYDGDGNDGEQAHVR